jgi:hypothetical protein
VGSAAPKSCPNPTTTPALGGNAAHKLPHHRPHNVYYWIITCCTQDNMQETNHTRAPVLLTKHKTSQQHQPPSPTHLLHKHSHDGKELQSASCSRQTPVTKLDRKSERASSPPSSLPCFLFFKSSHMSEKTVTDHRLIKGSFLLWSRSVGKWRWWADESCFIIYPCPKVDMSSGATVTQKTRAGKARTRFF